jgi:hypothetical protein
VANGPPEPALLESGENEQGLQRTTKHRVTLCTRLPKRKLFVLALPGVTTCRPGLLDKIHNRGKRRIIRLRLCRECGASGFRRGDDFQFLQLVVPSAFYRCAFVKDQAVVERAFP